MSFREWVGDLFWPSASTDNGAELKKLEERCKQEQEAVAKLNADEAALRQALESSLALLAAERDRSSSVDARLGGLLSLASVATTLVLATVTFLTRKEAGESVYVPWSVWVVAGLGTYTVIQFLGALRGAVKGLGRRAVEQNIFLSLLPDGKEAEAPYLVRILKGHANTRRDLALKIDDKVTWMAIAHRALMNAIGAMVLAAIGLFAVTIQRSWMRAHAKPQAADTHRPCP